MAHSRAQCQNMLNTPIKSTAKLSNNFKKQMIQQKKYAIVATKMIKNLKIGDKRVKFEEFLLILRFKK